MSSLMIEIGLFPEMAKEQLKNEHNQHVNRD